jgi:hypothetical protein
MKGFSPQTGFHGLRPCQGRQNEDKPKRIHHLLPFFRGEADCDSIHTTLPAHHGRVQALLDPKSGVAIKMQAELRPWLRT